MSENILFLAHVDESGSKLPNVAYEALATASRLPVQFGGSLTIGLLGANVEAASHTIMTAGAHIIAVSGPDFAQPRYATDAAAVEALCRAVPCSIVVAPGTPRFSRIMAGVALRLNGRIDTHLTELGVEDGKLTAKRWFYKQRLEAVIQRGSRPWFLLMDSGCAEPWAAQNSVGEPQVSMIDVPITPEMTRTRFTGIRSPRSDAQTIRPDAKLLFVAGAGWTKKQSDGKTHVDEAQAMILDFLHHSGASLGGSKSLVDQSGENQAVLPFMTHLNQVGQTGSTPRHPKGLSTCCHGEEPHVVGWRFINERRAINLDPNCGWARGKADVLYVADAFQVIARLNALLFEMSGGPALATTVASFSGCSRMQ